MAEKIEPGTLLTLTANIVSAHVANSRVGVLDIPVLIRDVHAALAQLGGTAETADPTPQKPAVPIRASIKADHLICLEDGKKLTMLKRYLMRTYGMTPADYRAKWKLPADYPMVAPDYAEKRRVLANSIGLGRKRVAAPAETPESPETPEPAPPPAATKRRRQRKAG